MAIQKQRQDTEQTSLLAQRRAFLQLPLEERRRLLAKQAEQVVSHYEEVSEQKDREEWQGSDIVEY